MVIGGAQIYALALPRTALLYATQIELDVPDADAFFPAFDAQAWSMENVEAHATAEGLRYRFVDLSRQL
jgi:dihydrofolate reductase